MRYILNFKCQLKIANSTVFDLFGNISIKTFQHKAAILVPKLLYRSYLSIKWSMYFGLPLMVKGILRDPNTEMYFPELILKWNAHH